MDKPSDVGVARQDAKFAKNRREGVARESREYGELLWMMAFARWRAVVSHGDAEPRRGQT